jgi:hypothetical protein
LIATTVARIRKPPSRREESEAREVCCKAAKVSDVSRDDNGVEQGAVAITMASTVILPSLFLTRASARPEVFAASMEATTESLRESHPVDPSAPAPLRDDRQRLSAAETQGGGEGRTDGKAYR